MTGLVIRDLHVAVEDKEILRGVSLTVRPGEIHALMGPNGSGKSTLALALAGAPGYTITKGDILLDGASLLPLTPDKRAQAGFFLGFQYPVAVSGVPIGSFLRTALNAKRSEEERMSVGDFHKTLFTAAEAVHLDTALLNRSLNDGFSGGERKKLEILQLLLLQPKYAVLDETDSGLDVDALRQVAAGIQAVATAERGILLITHYQRLLEYIRPQFVHVLAGGTIIRSGDSALARDIERSGYDPVLSAA